MMLSNLSGLYAGQDVFVLANGPSLDVVDLSKVPRERSIGVNRILRPGGANKELLSNGWSPQYIIFQDLQVWSGIQGRDAGEKERMLACNSTLLILRSLFDGLRPELPIERCIPFETEIKPAGSLQGRLCDCYLTGTVAAQIAARMVNPGGRVLLCGMDLNYPEGSKDHSYGTGKRIGCNIDRAPEAAEFLSNLRSKLAGNVEFVVVGNSLLKNEKFQFFSLTRYS
jgi:hypothetical protein